MPFPHSAGARTLRRVRWLLAGCLALVAMRDASAHEVRLLPLDDDTQTSSLPFATKAAHLIFDTSLDWGLVLIGQSAVRTLDVTNSAPQSLDVELELPAGLSADAASFQLAPGASRSLTLTWTPTTVADWSGVVNLRSTHAGAPALEEPLAVHGTARLGPSLRFRIDGVPSSEFDAGEIPRLPRYLGDILEPTFRFAVEIENIGDTAATEVIFLPEGHEGPESMSSAQSPECISLGRVCTADPDLNDPVFDIPAGGSVSALITALPIEIGPIDEDFIAFYQTGSGESTATVKMLAESVPYVRGSHFTDLDASQGSAGQAAGKTVTDDWADAINSGNDPLSAYRPTGLDPTGVFSAEDVDLVEARSGNLTLTVPLGQRFDAGGGLSYGLTAVYNSNVWARDTVYPPPTTCTPCVRLPPMSWEYPDPANNVAMGWSVHLGRLVPPIKDWPGYAQRSRLDKERVVHSDVKWLYIGPDGSRHEFSAGLNQPRSPFAFGPGVDEPVDFENQEFLYARDGSFLRLRRISATERHVETPDGVMHVFRLGEPAVASHPDAWRLVEMRDRFGNTVTIRYDDFVWTIEDAWRQGPTAIEIHFKPSSSIAGLAADAFHYPVVVDRVELPSFGATAAAPSRRSFTFRYDAATGVPRPPSSTYHLQAGDAPVDLPLLAAIGLPDGSEYAVDYHPAAPGVAEGLRPRRVSIPTGASIDYDWGPIRDTVANDCTTDAGMMAGVGVTARTVLGAAGASSPLEQARWLRERDAARDDLPDGADPNQLFEGACWAYFGSDQPDLGDTGPPIVNAVTPPAELRVAIWRLQQDIYEDPRSSVSLRYFSIWPFQDLPGSAQGWTNRERGLQLSRFEPRDAAGRLLSNALYDCQVLPNSSLGDQIAADSLPVASLLQNGACTLVESQYRRYELPAADHCESPGGSACSVGARIIDEATYHHDETTTRWTATSKSDYDGLGHHRTVQKTSSFDFEQPRTEFTRFHPGSGTITLDAEGRPSGEPAWPSAWILGTWDRRTVQEGGTVYGSEACFDAATGWLSRRRTWAGASAGPRDLLVQREHGAAGLLEREKHYSGDVTALASTPLCALALPAAPEFTQRVENQAGREARRWVDEGCAVPGDASSCVYERHETIDPATGWVASSLSNAGETTVFSYDDLGRPLGTDSGRTADVDFSYERVPEPADASVLTWRLTAVTRQADGTGELTRYVASFDELGRLASESIDLPGGETATQRTVYHPSGNRRSLSSLDFPSQKTQWRYDVRGRPRIRDLPDGSRISQSWQGVRVRRTKRFVKTSSAGEQAAISSAEFDNLGRLRRLSSFLEANPADKVVTSFDYDPSGRRTRAVRGVQSRTWDYDGRGFLLRERIPELAGQAIDFELFNSRGQALRIREPASLSHPGGRSTARQFDALGRPTGLTVEGRSIKAWTYHTSGFGKGQVDTATRFNPLDGERHGSFLEYPPTGEPETGTMRVASSFLYDDAGRPNQRTTSVDWLATAPVPETRHQGTFVQSWGYDDSSNVTSTSYPYCTHHQDCDQSPRILRRDYAEGRLTRIRGDLGAKLSYWKSGQLKNIDHWTGVGPGGDLYHLRDHYAIDASGVPRIAGASLAGTPAATPGVFDYALELGAYDYDGAGNITAIGADSFLYDAQDRLVAAEVAGEPFSYTYDPYDNLTVSAVDPATNRLTDAGGQLDYDAFGNLVSTQAGPLFYDELNKLVLQRPAGEDYDCKAPGAGCTLAVYDHDDLRILHIRSGEDPRWTLRDRGGHVLREFIYLGAGTRKAEDHVWVGRKLISSFSFELGVKKSHHSDHLDSVRWVGGSEPGAVHFGPFGEPLDVAKADRFGFTGHENDGNGLSVYMRGRSYLPGVYDRPENTNLTIGRFLQIDPARDGWNPYAYVGGNPINRIDPDGLLGKCDPHCIDLATGETTHNPSQAFASVVKTDPEGAAFYVGPFLATTTAAVGAVAAVKAAGTSAGTFLISRAFQLTSGARAAGAATVANLKAFEAQVRPFLLGAASGGITEIINQIQTGELDGRKLNQATISGALGAFFGSRVSDSSYLQILAAILTQGATQQLVPDPPDEQGSEPTTDDPV